ncbi:response regulator [Paenibacillus wynnii]|uniref:response regulator n=1 Tax=Paenibacillus wynnii TaxID=268407 RepID=UPI00278DCA19|nr:response regulator [Paenibacillus wynnii]MDQ0193579.1 DNA-binding response OmpR family regulator [Paenibacillus wynnii]
MYRIMMIEDDEKIRRIVADTLIKWQYDVVEVTRFDQVLTEFKQTGPHLILLDINLPVFDGYYLLSMPWGHGRI